MSRTKTLFTIGLLAAAALRAATVDQLVRAHLAARGGEERIRAVRSLRMTGRISNPHGGEMPMTVEWRRPGAVRIEATIQGMKMIQAFDGERGWLVVPFGGRMDPQPAGAEDVARLRRSADFEGPLVDAAAKDNRIDLVGRESMEGTPVDHLRVTRADGEVVDLYLDAESHLVIRESGTATQQGMEARYAVTFGAFREVGGLLVPFERERRVEGMPGAQVTTIEAVELDVALPDERFAMPIQGAG